MRSETLESTTRILSDLVGFPTISADSNLEMIAYASELLSALGARLSMTLDESGHKANLFATLGPEGDGGIVLSGHSDVVPVEGQDWASDPFAIREADGRLYGRGTCDMKGFIACTLAMAPHFAELDLKRPLHFAFTYDEEVGCFGARALVEELERTELRPSVAIIGEPTMMRIIEGHKGCFEYTTEFRGLAGHASSPERGVNAVEYAVRYISRLMALAEELKTRAPKGNRFDPPWTTLQVGTISGGAARNVIADHCAVEWEMRPVRNEDADFVKDRIRTFVEAELKPAMQAVFAGADIVTHVIGEVDGLEPVTESEARQIVSELTGLTEAEVVAFGTEAGLFQKAGISSVICGPGSIEQAHKADEFVSLEQLDQCLGMLERLGRKVS
ncbi:acetylornithine deacetylase [Nitratireductor sp. L1-7-SE]|uniref:Acetylornithine deacetylase n=1 Tax=Nitratireductor rhodophyticola TaxID=2854036 RepID=A0ABS7R2J3_9HYPH|nr:acetylornithine deacetylase [Nitratireductor rhodophyticola]MBY8915150.1 acetylornithine deacetylase [Nitratireductor rhodophyticola]MBY8919780.1 acetylornithine deacetylase [Nitratireductor rhodophyticola]